MPCKEVPVQSLQQIWPILQFMLPNKDTGALQEQSQKPKTHQLHAGPMYAQDSSNLSHSEESSSDESFCLQLQVQSNHAEGKQIPNPVHLKMNLAFHLKLHYTRNMYLRACLDTCADMNIMPGSVYQLVFKCLEMRKFKLCKMQISTCTADTVKIIGSCTFGIIHLDTKMLVPVTFYLANNEGSVLLSYKTTLALHLIQPRSRLDYLPPQASLITSTIDHSRKTKLTSLKVQQSKQEESAQRQEP